MFAHEIWIWQTIVSLHMAGLARSLLRQGCKVNYVAEQDMTEDRLRLGWQVPEMPGVQLRFLPDSGAVERLVSEAPAGSFHLCQGIRGNGRISKVQRALERRGLCQWIVLETVDDAGVMGMLKRWLYSQRLLGMSDTSHGVLAIGHRTMDWVIARGMPAARVFPFTYFLPDAQPPETSWQRPPGPFRFLFVGQLIPRKRLELLVLALHRLMDQEFQLLIVGSGSQERRLRRLAELALPGRVRWLGVRPHSETSEIMRQADCLVLPSRHDGWGAVISEALLAGTPAICSEGCGAAGVVRSSGIGGVFRADQSDELQARLNEQLKSGPIGAEGRARLASWASALTADTGARYLVRILNYDRNGGRRPMPPWHGGEC